MSSPLGSEPASSSYLQAVRGNRLRPPPYNPRWVLLRRLAAAIEKAIEWSGSEGRGTILDFGCAERPYEPIVRRYFDRYLPADLAGNQNAEITVSTRGELPLADGAVDAVLSTQVLEHVADPRVYLREAARVLRPGGTMVLSTHGFWVYHPDPVDFWRWTRAGLELELQWAGLEVVRSDGVLNLAATSVLLWQDATRSIFPWGLRQLYSLGIQMLIWLVDRIKFGDRREDAAIFVIRARKPLARG